MTTADIQQNEFLLKTQIFKVLIQHQDDFVGKHFKLFTHKDSHFCINVSFINNEGIWFNTCMKSIANKTASNIQHYKLHSKQTNDVIAAILEKLSIDILIEATDFICERVPAPRPHKKFERDTAPILKRRVKLESIEPLEVQQESHLRIPSTQKQRNEAQVERLIFNDAKMWKWQI